MAKRPATRKPAADPPKRERKSTRTSPYGSPGRSNHDSTPFYNSRLYASQVEPWEGTFKHARISSEKLDRVYLKSAEQMTEIPDHSVQLVVTSPPYNVQKDYDEDLSLAEYRSLLQRVFGEVYRVLTTGGRACINIANLGRKPYIPLHAYLIADLLEIGFLMRGEIIWDKGSSAGSSTAWGSWMSAANPVLRDVHEYILIFSRESFARQSDSRESTIQRQDFLDWTKSVWTFPATSARKIGHPAPFPEELPRRLIELYSFKGDVILDPFAGSGTTCVAALHSGRHFVGYEINSEYHSLAQQRIEAAQKDDPGSLKNQTPKG